MLVNDLIDTLNFFVDLNGELPCMYEVNPGWWPETEHMTTGMRTITVFSIPCFIKTGIAAVNYYFNSDHVTPVEYGGA